MVSNLFGTWDTRESLLKSTLSAAISLLSANGEIVHQHTREVLQIQELLNGDWEVKLQHIYREGNKVVDFLAGLGHRLAFGSHLILVMNNRLGYFVRYDCISISELRQILIDFF
ncbi:hypothetical protein LINPERHAP1_LOCUS7791 [Linum perenne]